MNIGDRIQQLRKAAGISQEELADKTGVSRQAVSKWESGQSIPDMEKIILLSDYFNTTTDYLLKGIAPAEEKQSLWNAMLFAIGGTILNAVGLITALILWIEWQTAYASGIGMIIMLFGTGIFLAGQCIDNRDKAKAKYYFILLNIWILLPVPLACCFFVITRFMSIMKPFSLFGPILFYWVVYITMCIAVDVIVVKRNYKQ